MGARTERRKALPERYEVGFLREFDRRTELYQRLSSIYETILEDVGGAESIAHTRLALIERFVFLEAVLQELEQDIAKNPKASEEKLSRWIQGLNSLTGLAKTIGLDRKVKTVNLKAYVRGRRA